MNTRQITVIGYYLDERIDLKSLKNSLTFKCVYEDPTELIFELADNSFFQIFNYGSVVFFGVSKTEQTDLINSVRTILRLSSKELMSENFIVVIDPESEYRVHFDRIVVPALNLDIAKILMLNIAQSVALDSYVEKSTALLMDTAEFSNTLEQRGKFKLRGKKLLKYLGRTLNLRNNIVTNLYIFDSPLLTWNDEFLNKINNDLIKELDISLRYRSLQENLDIVKENLETFKDLNLHSHSSFLEWIIIILIAVEIVNMIVEKFL